MTERSPSESSFSVVIGRFHGTVVVTVRGAVDELAATKLASTLQDLIEGQGNLAIAIDLGRVSRLGPSGLQVLSAAASGLEGRGGRLWLSDPPDGIVHVLKAGGLSQLVGYPRRLEGKPRCLPDHPELPGHPCGFPPTSRKGTPGCGSVMLWPTQQPQSAARAP